MRQCNAIQAIRDSYCNQPESDFRYLRYSKPFTNIILSNLLHYQHIILEKLRNTQQFWQEYWYWRFNHFHYRNTYCKQLCIQDSTPGIFLTKNLIQQWVLLGFSHFSAGKVQIQSNPWNMVFPGQTFGSGNTDKAIQRHFLWHSAWCCTALMSLESIWGFVQEFFWFPSSIICPVYQDEQLSSRVYISEKTSLMCEMFRSSDSSLELSSSTDNDS